MPHQFFLHGQFNFVGGGEGKYTHAPPSPGGGGGGVVCPLSHSGLYPKA
jgi:hypothetical protein